MSQQPALQRHQSQIVAPLIDLRQRIVARQYEAHQRVQASIDRDWAELLRG